MTNFRLNPKSLNHFINNINSEEENFKNLDKNDFENETKQISTVPNMDNLKVSNDKNYNEPL